MTNNPEESPILSGSQAYIDALRKIGADEQTIKDAERAAQRTAERKRARELSAADK